MPADSPWRQIGTIRAYFPTYTVSSLDASFDCRECGSTVRNGILPIVRHVRYHLCVPPINHDLDD